MRTLTHAASMKVIGSVAAVNIGIFLVAVALVRTGYVVDENAQIFAGFVIIMSSLMSFFCVACFGYVLLDQWVARRTKELAEAKNGAGTRRL